MIELGNEIANTRVELLKKLKFKDCHDIAEMHWKNCSASNIELIEYSNRIQYEKENLMIPFKNHV